MATVIGIFERCYNNNKPMPVVKPGNQTRRFTHIDDTVKMCYFAWKMNKCRYYSISHKKSYSILQVAKMFSSKIKLLPKRPGERYASALTNMNLSKKIHSLFHFGEFARIYQSFLKMNECINSNSVGTNAVFNYCLKNKIKLIYSATSASLGNKGSDKNLSPYAFTKAKNLELLENLKKWFNFK